MTSYFRSSAGQGLPVTTVPRPAAHQCSGDKAMDDNDADTLEFQRVILHLAARAPTCVCAWCRLMEYPVVVAS